MYQLYRTVDWASSPRVLQEQRSSHHPKTNRDAEGSSSGLGLAPSMTRACALLGRTCISFFVYKDSKTGASPP